MSSHWRSRLGLVAACAAASVLVVGVATPATAQESSHLIVDGTADWGVKESFRSYVTSPIADGEISTSGGVIDNGDSYRFPDGTGELDLDGQTLEVSFAGAVTFSGHEGVLEVTISDVAVRVDGDDAALYVGGSAFADLQLPAGALSLEGDTLTLSAVPVTLTAEGAARFAYNGEPMYDPGEQLDPITISLVVDGADGTPGGDAGDDAAGDDAAGDDAAGDDAAAGELPETGAPVALLLATGGALLLAGAGVLWLIRRRTTASV